MNPQIQKTGKKRTFRITGVPLDWDKDRLEKYLAEHGPSGAEVRSLSREINGLDNTGTAIFQDEDINHPDNNRWEIPLPRSSDERSRYGPDRPLVLDDGFIGLTPLFSPLQEDHKIDVIAISGLGAHAFGSFADARGSHMWLRDSLPYDLTLQDTNAPMARVMTYGYESSVAQSESFQNLEDLAISFLQTLSTLAPASTTRPVILVAHSLGGLIVKQALVILSKSNVEQSKKLLRAIYGIVFFGVPNEGMDISSLIAMVQDRPNRFLIESIGINSQILTDLKRGFHTVLDEEGGSEVFCFYETLMSPTAKEVEPGVWKMEGPKAILVSKSSATHGRHQENGPEHICVIPRTHSQLVKFMYGDAHYIPVRERLKGLARRALTARHRKQASDATIIIPYAQNPKFVSRGDILNDIKHKFGHTPYQDTVKTTNRIGLHGLGGTGKTQIALAYVYRLQEECPDASIFWVHASNSESFRDAYTSIAQELKIPNRDDASFDVLARVKDWLARRFKNRWLMVIDNADDSQLFYPRNQGDDNTELQKGGLGRYIPTCAQGSILITTRNKRAAVDLAPGQQPIDIGAMTGEEAGQLIRSKLDGFEISSDDALSLAMQLEYLPLAIGQAVAYIFKNSISVEKYLQMLQNSDNDLVTLLRREFVVGDQNADIPRSLASTWIISFQQIQRQDVFASEVLSLISLFHRQAIPQEFVNSYWHLRQSQNDKTVLKRKWEESTMGEEASVTEALGTLKAFAFISEGTDETVTMHRLVQLVMRNWLLEKDRLAKLVDQSVQILAGAFPISTHENRELCVRYLVHASAVLHASDTDPQDDIEARILLLGRLGYYHYYWNRWEDAEIYQRRVTELNIQVRGGEHSETLESIRHLGFTIMMQEGRTAEAKELLEETFRTQKRLLGEEHPGTLYAMELFARALLEEGIFNEAEALLRQAVEMTREENLLDTLSAIDGLALALVMQGRLKEAEELLRQVLGDFKRVVGEQHIDTTKLAGALADVLSDQGRFEESSRLMVQALETMKRVYGDEHPDTIEAMNGLAHTRRKLGHLGEALDLMRSCISLKVKVYGSNHKETIYGLEFLVDWEAEWKAEREADSETDPEADPEVV